MLHTPFSQILNKVSITLEQCFVHSLTARLFASFISISTLPFSPSRPSSRSSVDSLPCGETGSLKADRIALDRGTARAGCLAGSNVCEAEIAGDRDCPRWSGFEHCLSLRLVIHLSEDQATFAPAEGPFAVIYRSYASNHVRYVTENTAVHSEAARSHLDPSSCGENTRNTTVSLLELHLDSVSQYQH